MGKIRAFLAWWGGVQHFKKYRKIQDFFWYKVGRLF